MRRHTGHAPATTAPHPHAGRLLARALMTFALLSALAALMPQVASATITLGTWETAAAPGTDVPAYTMAEGLPGGTVTTVDTFRAAAVTQVAPRSNWGLKASVTAACPHSVPGITLPISAIKIEKAPTPGAYVSMTAAYQVITTAVRPYTWATATSGYIHFRVVIPAAQQSGTYTCALNIQAYNGGGATSIHAIALTVQVTASLTISNITNCPAGIVVGFTFAETAPGNTSPASGPYCQTVTAISGRWTASASITGAFTKASTGETLPGTAILVNGPDQGAGVYVDLSVPRNVDSLNPKATLTTGSINFKLAPAAGADSGNYIGTITFTVTTL